MRAVLGATTAIAVALLVLPGCTVIPAHDGLARLPVNRVVERIKCDLERAIIKKAEISLVDGSKPFEFLYGWAAKLHFTIIVDDQASLNPGATFMHTLSSTGTVSQAFTLGVGAGFITEAVRQEDYEYLLSFKDLRAEGRNRIGAYCSVPEGPLLESSLGLDALVDSALEPIETKVLYPGYNVGPGALPPVGTDLKPLDTKSQLAELKANRGRGKEGTFFNTIRQFSDDNDQQAKDIETRAQSVINNIVKPLNDLASSMKLNPDCLKDITFNQEEATASSIHLSSDVVKVYQASAKEKAVTAVEKDFEAVVGFANKMIASFKKCAAEKRTPAAPKLYDPIDAMSETINFYVTASGSITPTWKLVSTTAPLSPTFASASRKDTNTLILALGRPVPAPDGTLQASSAMNNQVLASLLSQAIAQRPTP